MASTSEQPPFPDRFSRSNRGKRLTKLLDEEIEEDEKFWNQDLLKEEENDASYEGEAEVADEFDSDFDEDEPGPEEEVENDVNDRTQTKKRLILPGKLAKKKKTAKKFSSVPAGISTEEKSSLKQEYDLAGQEFNEDLDAERTIRKSTRTSVIVKQAERDAIRAALQATMKPIKRKKEGEEKKMSQEEMLFEAAQTEIMNLRNLERVLAREEEVKKRAVVHKKVYDGPQIRYLSKNGKSVLEFSKGLSSFSEIYTTPVPYPRRAICVVTGLPARYRDPLSGLPYATKESFQIIRERYFQESSKPKREMTNMGSLFESLAGHGFSAKRRRSYRTSRCIKLCFHNGSRFLHIPAFENNT